MSPEDLSAVHAQIVTTLRARLEELGLHMVPGVPTSTESALGEHYYAADTLPAYLATYEWPTESGPPLSGCIVCLVSARVYGRLLYAADWYAPGAPTDTQRHARARAASALLVRCAKYEP